MSFTMNKAKENENKVLELLNKMPGSKFKLHPDEFSAYDILGSSDDIDTVVEVKQRREPFPTWYIEKKKIFDMCAQLEKEGKSCKEVNMMLCISVGSKHYLYDIKDLQKEWKETSRAMNKRTAKGLNKAGEKVVKEVYEFPFNSYKIELSEMSLGYNYEI